MDEQERDERYADTPGKCDSTVYRAGVPVGIFGGAAAWPMEHWVVRLRELTGARLDWHYFAGRAVLLGIADEATLCRVDAAIAETVPAEFAPMDFGAAWRAYQLS